MSKKMIALVLALMMLLGGAIALAVSSPEKAEMYTGVPAAVRGVEDGAQSDPLWYNNNTAGVIGLSLRDLYPDLTSKWYNVLPVDLSTDGVQTFPMVASNLYYIGSVTVTVSGDEITTTYEYPTGTGYCLTSLEETLAWFTTMEDISADFLEHPSSDLTFGTAVSREKDLNGQDYALLFVCNRLNYRIPLNNFGDTLTRYWPNLPKMADYFAAVRDLQEKVEADHAEKLAAAGAATSSDLSAATESDLAEDGTATESDLAEETEAEAAAPSAD